MRNIHKEVTDRIIAQLKKGVVPWRQPWSGKVSGSFPKNAVTDKGYSGVNVILLWSEAQERGYDVPRWLTYKQAAAVGGQVRKGEHGVQIVYYSSFDKADEEGKERRIGFLKTYTVFNVAQVDGLPEKYSGVVTVAVPRNPLVRDELADQFMVCTGARIEHGGSRAYFSRSTDHVQLPDFDTFESADHYYGTAFHELTHYTGGEGRLERKFGKSFGDELYSAEELVAELGSSFLCSEFGFDTEGADASYIDHWVRILTDHSHAIVTAASLASKAVEFLRGKALEEDHGKTAQAA